MQNQKPVNLIVDARLRINRDHLDPDTVSELRKMFTRTNPQFFKMQRMGFWTGQTECEIRSYRVDEPFLSLPRGAMDRIREFLESRGYTIHAIYDRSLKLERLKLDLKLELRPYQVKAADALANSGNGILRGPCGSGKTVILLGAIARLKQPTLIIVHTEALMRQWASMISEWLGFVPGKLGGKNKTTVRPITIGMQQTIWRHAKDDPAWAKEFGCIVGDEVHHWAARTFQIAADMFPAAYRIGASASEKRKDGMEYLIYDTFGPCLHEIYREDLVEIKKLLPIKMYLVKTDYEDLDYLEEIEMGSNANWVGMINRITEDPDRNALILKTVLAVLDKDPTHRVLMLTERVKACTDWQEIIQSCGHKCGIMVGGSENKETVQSSITQLRHGSIRVAVGTKIADEGLDIPQLTHVILTCPVHNHPKRLEQMAGRAARTYEGKQRASAIYFWDYSMFPTPALPEDSPFKLINRKKAFFRSLKQACAELYLWNPAGTVEKL